ncbi:MAG TPA: hypothetical protein VGJ01_21655, partial [Pseudolabrys sp.]
MMTHLGWRAAVPGFVRATQTLATKLRISAGIVLAVAGASYAVDAQAADVTPMKVPPASSAPRTCTGDPWDFISTNCQLTWAGITIYGTIDAGVTYQTHGTPYDPRSA